MIALMLTVFGAAVVLYCSFCRLVHTNNRTRVSVRLSVWSLAVVSMLAILGPTLTAWRPDALHAAVVCAMAAHLYIGSRVWRYGVPQQFQRGLS